MFILRPEPISALLDELKPVLKSTDDFRLAAEKKGYATRIRAGKYAIKTRNEQQRNHQYPKKSFASC